MYCKCYLNLHSTCIASKHHTLITIEGPIVKNLVFRTTILLGLISSALAADLNTVRIDQFTGLKGKFNEKEGVYKVTFPRNDVKIIVDGWTMPPFMSLGTWPR